MASGFERRREARTYGVSADDLAALALALSVSPLALLLPTTPSAVLPDGKSFPAEQIWNWGTGEYPLFATDDVLAYIRDSRPLDWPEIETAVVGQLRGAMSTRIFSTPTSRQLPSSYLKLWAKCGHGGKMTLSSKRKKRLYLRECLYSLSALGEIRTHTGRVLNPFPLPVGIRGPADYGLPP